MRRTACLALVVATGLANAQQSGLHVAGRKVELGPPTAVSVGVDQVYWKRDGSALAFYGQDADGTFLGVYDLENGRGKDVMRFAEGTNVQYESWLPQRSIYLILMSRPIPGREARRWSLVAVDALSLKANEAWGAEYAASEEVSVDVNPSPLLDHAIVTVSSAKGRIPIVLLRSGTSAVLSRDVATAWEQGMEFSGWSADGTAYFSGGGAPSDARSSYVRLADGQSSGVVEFKISIQGGSEILSGVPIIGMLFKGSPVAPEAGTPVHELMPNNAALRPVLSRGPYKAPKQFPHVVYPVPEDTVAIARERRDGTHGIWLVGVTGIEGNPYTKEGLLVSAYPGKFWMCDDGNWVAYELAGALFIRRITYGGRPFSGELTLGG